MSSQADISGFFIDFLGFSIHIQMLISAIFSHFAMKIVIEGNQQKVKKNFDQKKFWIFFSGKGQQMDPKIGNFEGWIPANVAICRGCHGYQMKGLFKRINLVYDTLRGNARNPVKIGLFNTWKQY